MINKYTLISNLKLIWKVANLKCSSLITWRWQKKEKTIKKWIKQNLIPSSDGQQESWIALLGLTPTNTLFRETQLLNHRFVAVFLPSAKPKQKSIFRQAKCFRKTTSTTQKTDANYSESSYQDYIFYFTQITDCPI